jgi:hypothetical protein
VGKLGGELIPCLEHFDPERRRFLRLQVPTGADIFFRFDPGSMGAVDLCQELFLVCRHKYAS